MTSRFQVLRSGLAAALCAALNGCIGPAAGRDATAIRSPAMPTVAPAPSKAQVSVPESEILFAALRAAQHSDIPAALRTLETVRDPSDRARLAARVAAMLAEHDPLAAAAFATALPVGAAQTSGLEAAAHEKARRDPDAALRWALELSDPSTANIARRAVATRLVHAGPRATVDRITALPSGPARDSALGFAAAEWARQDPDNAVSWLRERPDDALRQHLISSVGFAIAQTKPPRAVAVAAMLAPGRDRSLIYAAIAETWVAVDPIAALAWIKELPSGELRDAALAGFDSGLGASTSRRIARAPGQRRPGARIRGGTSAAAAWLALDSPGFAAWLAMQSPGLSQEEAILEYVRQRGGLEPAAIGQWVAALPGGSTRDRAMEVYFDGLLQGSASKAANWLQSLPRADRSDERIEKTARQWLLTNPDAAAAWLQETTLPPERKEWLLRQAGR